MQTVRALVHETRNTIRCLSHGNEHASQVLSTLDRMDLSAENQHDWVASRPPHDRDLRHAIDEIPQSLQELSDVLQNAIQPCRSLMRCQSVTKKPKAVERRKSMS